MAAPGPGPRYDPLRGGWGPGPGLRARSPGALLRSATGGRLGPTIPPRPPRLLQILDAFNGILLGFAGGLALLELRLVLLYLVGAGWMGGWD